MLFPCFNPRAEEVDSDGDGIIDDLDDDDDNDGIPDSGMESDETDSAGTKRRKKLTKTTNNAVDGGCSD